MADPDLENIRSYYDSRAPTYDSSFHPQQAADYLSYAAAKPGESWLDLACGTGLITLLAAKAVGPGGRVVGIDLSRGMLDRAKAKAAADFGSEEAARERVRFVQRDVTDLSGLEAEGVVEAGFDVLTCSSALPMPKGIDKMFEHWVGVLKPGGRMIVDVPSTRALLNTGAFARIAPRCGLKGEMPDDRRWIEGEESLREKLEGAGLRCERVFTSREYEFRVYEHDKLEWWFERTVNAPMYAPFREDEGRKAVAKREWLGEMRKMADEKGDVRESMSFFVGVAVKEA